MASNVIDLNQLPPWHCDGCKGTFGPSRRWHRAKGWLPDKQLPNGKLVPRAAKLCDYCFDNHRKWAP